MKHLISKGMIILAAFVIALAAGWQGSIFQTANASENLDQDSPLGSITVCKIVVNTEGEVSSGSEISGATSSLASIDFDGNETVAPATDVLETAVWTTPLALNADMLESDTVNDASCLTHDNLEIGSYFYAEEELSDVESWNTPLYNDQHTRSVSALADFFPYSGELFTENTSDDSLRNTNADGHIVLTADRPDRTLVVLNRMAETTPAIGSITVCKIILDAKGRVVDGSRASTTTFSISGINFAGTSEVPQAIDVLPTAQFAVPLNLNKDVLGNDNVYDAACTTYPNLKMGSYYYDRENISTSTTNWIAPRYNDQNNKTLATTTDFFAYSPELFTSDPNDDATRNTDADGHIVLGETRADRMLIVLNRMASTSDDENVKPVITLLGNATVTITKDDGYTDAGATAQDEEDGVITDKIVTANNVNHTTPGTYSVTYNVTDSGGKAADQVTRTVIVNTRATGCTSICGGGGGSSSGGGGGGGGSKINLEITNEAITLNDMGAAVVTWNTNLQSTSQVLYDVTSRGSTTTLPTVGSYLSRTATSTIFVTSHRMTITGLAANTTYYFRPVSARADEDAIGKELKITPATTTVATAVSAPTVTTTTITRQPCQEYLLNYIKLGEQNAPFEVRKLETFLNAFEGFSLPVDGIYDQRDFAAVVAFQERHMNEILSPWGHIKGTGYVYYTTRKYINEVYCKNMFPLTAAQLAEIEEFKALLQRTLESGGSPDNIPIDSVVGSKDTEPTVESILAELSNADNNNGNEKNLVARLYDSLKDRARTVGVTLILLAILLAGIALFRSRRQTNNDNDFPPLV